MHFKKLMTMAMIITIVSTEISLASSLDKVQFIKIAPQDQKAIMKTPDGKLQVIKPGDAIGDSAKVIEIGQGRIVLEDKTDKGVETVIVHLENGKQRIERVRKQGEGQAMPVASQPADKQTSR